MNKGEEEDETVLEIQFWYGHHFQKKIYSYKIKQKELKSN